MTTDQIDVLENFKKQLRELKPLSLPKRFAQSIHYTEEVTDPCIFMTQFYGLMMQANAHQIDYLQEGSTAIVLKIHGYTQVALEPLQEVASDQLLLKIIQDHTEPAEYKIQLPAAYQYALLITGFRRALRTLVGLHDWQFQEVSTDENKSHLAIRFVCDLTDRSVSVVFMPD